MTVIKYRSIISRLLDYVEIVIPFVGFCCVVVSLLGSIIDMFLTHFHSICDVLCIALSLIALPSLSREVYKFKERISKICLRSILILNLRTGKIILLVKNRSKNEVALHYLVVELFIDRNRYRSIMKSIRCRLGANMFHIEEVLCPECMRLRSEVSSSGRVKVRARMIVNDLERQVIDKVLIIC